MLQAKAIEKKKKKKAFCVQEVAVQFSLSRLPCERFFLPDLAAE